MSEISKLGWLIRVGVSPPFHLRMERDPSNEVCLFVWVPPPVSWWSKSIGLVICSVRDHCQHLLELKCHFLSLTLYSLKQKCDFIAK